MKLADLKTVAVLGMGTMGRGIAQCLAATGYNVRSYEVDERARASTMPLIESLQSTLIQANMLSEELACAALARVRLFDDLGQCVEGAQLVVETIPEILELKIDLYARVDQLCEPEAILASNTSGLSITKVAAATRRPDKVAGFHWWNPAHLMPLVEVIKGERTSDDTAEFLLALSRKLGKKPILVRRDVPGFVGNRLQFAVLREALHLVQEGIASPEDVDTAMKAGPGLRYSFLGPLETADLGGLDVFASISSYLFAELAANTGPPECLTRCVAEGKLGVKSGAGFYPYGNTTLGELLAARDRKLIELARVATAPDTTQE